MTRINLLPPLELHFKHLVAEWKEIRRPFQKARPYRTGEKVPQSYTMGKGHEIFFYDKLLWLRNRVDEVHQEMLKGGYKPDCQKMMDIILPAMEKHPELCNDWTPSEAEIAINRARIEERLREMEKSDA